MQESGNQGGETKSDTHMFSDGAKNNPDMQRLLSGQAGGPFPGVEERQQQDWRQKVPPQLGRWSRAELQRVPQVRKDCVGLETSRTGMTNLTL